MKLKRISITNFRSITKAHAINLSDMSVLVGRNNEGKSNILKALNIAMNVLQRKGFSFYAYRDSDESKYNWKRDFPISLQNRKGKKQTIFRLEFQLTDSEVGDISKNLKSYLNGILPIEIQFDENERTSVIKIVKKGRGAPILEKKKRQIIEYIAQHISFVYIPAVRTEENSMDIINEMISLELSKIEGEEQFKDAIEKIKELQKPILDGISDIIKKSICQLLPNVTGVRSLVSDNDILLGLRRRTELWINDGTETKLEYKGDGVKSLVALSLLKDAKQDERFSLIAIEEPESHLHPGAIHALRDSIYALKENNQVILSTHNGLFIDRDNIAGNIIVDGGKAIPARNIATIRDILGIKQSDNLLNASYVLVVEGKDDEISLKALLPLLNENIKRHLLENNLVIERTGGASNLSYKLSTLENSICSYYVLLDHDIAGKEAYQKAHEDDLLAERNCTFTICNGMQESEFEDCLNIDCYKDILESEYGIRLDVSDFSSNSKRSNRMKQVFLSQGKLWNDNVEKKVKMSVSSAVSRNPENALNEHKRTSIDALVFAINNMLIN